MQNQFQHNAPKWHDVVFAAEAANEPFEDITIVTTRSEFVDLACVAAADIVHRVDPSPSEDKIRLVASKLIAAHKIAVQEHVTIDATGITVCIDVPDIDADTVPCQALGYVARALDILDGSFGTVTFSGDIRYNISDVPWIWNVN